MWLDLDLHNNRKKLETKHDKWKQESGQKANLTCSNASNPDTNVGCLITCGFSITINHKK